MRLQTGSQIITTHALSNISRSKCHQTMKFHNMMYTFFGKSSTKYGGEASPRPFYKKSKLSISLDQHHGML